MTSSWAWMDFGEKERDHALEVVALFAEEGAVDELGLGTIRDAVSDELFPGTSTIQTRARYFLFIPWIFQMAAEAGRRGTKTVDELQRFVRQREVNKLIDALVKGGESQGVIGRQRREALRQVPSATYWRGLLEWGIRLNGASRDALFRRLAQGARVPAAESDDGSPGLIFAADWHPALPPAPEDLFETTTFALTRDEAEFLRERILRSKGDSLLAFLVGHATETTDAPFVGEHPLRAEFPKDTETLVEASRRFALVMHGAAILYQLWVTELKGDAELVESNRGALGGWVSEMRDEHAMLAQWRIEDFFATVCRLNPRLSRRTLAFCDEWRRLVIRGDLTVDHLDAPAVRRLISERERSLKGPRARLAPGAERQREIWLGMRGAIRMDYRWRAAQIVLNDILRGLHGEEASDA